MECGGIQGKVGALEPPARCGSVLRNTFVSNRKSFYKTSRQKTEDKLETQYTIYMKVEVLEGAHIRPRHERYDGHHTKSGVQASLDETNPTQGTTDKHVRQPRIEGQVVGEGQFVDGGVLRRDEFRFARYAPSCAHETAQAIPYPTPLQS